MAKEQRSLTILHVSDMQFGRRHQFPQDPDAPPNEFDTLLERIWDDIRKLRDEEGLRPDLLICTGDLAEWAWQKEFADAFKFLGTLAERLELKRDRVITIPGNHDVHRKECLRYFERCVESGEPIVAPWYPKWQQYEKAFNEFYQDVSGVRFTPDEPWSLFAIKDLEVVVAGLNSTWIEGPDWPADGSLPDNPAKTQLAHAGYCHEKQLRWFADKLMSPDYSAWLRIGAVHHNLERGIRNDDENLRDVEDFERVLGEHLNLVLHGHTHRARFGWVRDKFPWFATGSAGLKQNVRPYGVPNQYQFLILEPEGVRIRARFYMPDEKDWADETRYKDGRQTGGKTIPLRWQTVKRFLTSQPNTFDTVADWPSDPLDGSAEIRRETLASQVQMRRVFMGRTFLSVVAECCRLQFAAERDRGMAPMIDEVCPVSGSSPYLRVACHDGGFVAQYPVGATPERPAMEALDAFARDVLAQYRAAAPGTRAEFVFGGPLAADESLRQHAASLGIKLMSLIEYQGLIDFGGYLEKQNQRLLSDTVYPPDLYVPQRMNFEAVSSERSFTDAALDRVAAWLIEPDPRFILILGEFGTGKTFLLRQLALRLGQNRQAPVPLLIELRGLEKARKLDELLAQHFARHQFDRLDLPALHYMIKQGRVVLLFDGFDELALRVGYAQAADHLDTLIEAAEGDARVIVSCRTSYFENDQQIRLALGRHVERVRGLRWCRLQRFDRSQIYSFLFHRFGTETEACAWQRMLEQVHDLLGLGENPRMLSFICQLKRKQLEEAEERTGGVSAAELYRILLLEFWLKFEINRRHPKGVPLLLTAEQWLDPATVLALTLWTRTDRWLTLDELRQTVRDALGRYAPEKLSLVEEATQMLGGGTLFIRDEEGRFTFVHQSVMEWLVARRIARELAQRSSSQLLNSHELSPLMAEFLTALDLDGCKWWMIMSASRVVNIGDPISDAFVKNAVLLRQRLGVAAPQKVQMAKADLRGQDLTKLELRDADLREADLREAILVNCDLTGADLSGADLNKAVCDGAKFIGANLERVRAEECSALGADFSGAKLDGSVWRRARLLGSNFPIAGAPSSAQTLKELNLWGAAMPAGEGLEVRLTGAASETYAVAWSQDGALLATAHHDGSVRVWDATSGCQLLLCQGHEGAVTSVAWSPDGARLVSASGDRTVQMWDAASGRQLLLCQGHERCVTSVAWSPDGARLVSGSDDQTVRVWDAASGRELLFCRGHEGRITAVAWSPDGARFAIGSDDQTVRVWDAASGRELLLCQGHDSLVSSVGWSHDGARLASGSWDKTVRLWDAASGRQLLLCKGHVNRVTSVGWSPDSGRLASGSWDKTVRVWDTGSGRELLLCQGHESWVTSVGWSHDGARLASCSSDRSSRVWDPTSGHQLLRCEGRNNTVASVGWSSDGPRIASGLGDNTVRVWNAISGRSLVLGTGHKDRITSVSWSPDGTRLASGSSDKTVRIWETASGCELLSCEGHEDTVTSVSWSPDGAHLASGSSDRIVRVWDPANGRKLFSCEGHENIVTSLTWSHHGTRLASGSTDKTVRVWDVFSRQLILCREHTFPVFSVAWSPNGLYLASASGDKNVQVWEAASGRPLFLCQGHQETVVFVEWSHDGARLVSASGDRTVRVWEATSGRQLLLSQTHEGEVTSVNWSHDGRWIISGDQAGRIRVWDVRVLAQLGSNPPHSKADGSQNGNAGPPIEARCVALFFPTESGLVAVRPDGHIRLTGIGDQPYPEEGLDSSLHGAGLRRFSLAEVRKWRPDLFLRDDEPLFS